MSFVIYIISISLQIAGALMLIIFSLSTKRKKLIRAFAKSHMIVRDGKTKELSYNHEAFIDTCRSVYFAKVSVVFIAAGYILGVFSDIGKGNRWIAAGLIAAITIGLILITKAVVEGFVKQEDKPITNVELENAGVEADMESMSPEVIDEALGLGEISFRGK